MKHGKKERNERKNPAGTREAGQKQEK